MGLFNFCDEVGSGIASDNLVMPRAEYDGKAAWGKSVCGGVGGKSDLATFSISMVGGKCGALDGGELAAEGGCVSGQGGGGGVRQGL